MENLFSTCTVINPRTDALRSKGENRSGEYRKDGIVGVSVTEAKFEGRRFIVRLLTNFLWSIGQKWPPDSDWNDGQSCFDRRWDAVNERSGCLIFGEGGKGKEEKKSSIEVDQIWGGKSLGSNSMHRCCGDW